MNTYQINSVETDGKQLFYGKNNKIRIKSQELKSTLITISELLYTEFNQLIRRIEEQKQLDPKYVHNIISAEVAIFMKGKNSPEFHSLESSPLSPDIISSHEHPHKLELKLQGNLLPVIYRVIRLKFGYSSIRRSYQGELSIDGSEESWVKEMINKFIQILNNS